MTLQSLNGRSAAYHDDQPILRQLPVPSTALLEKLDERMEDGRIHILVCAPARDGKATTIRMWAERLGCKFANYPVPKER